MAKQPCRRPGRRQCGCETCVCKDCGKWWKEFDAPRTNPGERPKLNLKRQGTVIVEYDDENGYTIGLPDGSVEFATSRKGVERIAKKWSKENIPAGYNGGLLEIDYRSEGPSKNPPSLLPGEIAILRVLSYMNGATAYDVQSNSSGLYLTTQQIASRIQRLFRRGWVDRSLGLVDGRETYLYEATDEGRAALKRNTH